MGGDRPGHERRHEGHRSDTAAVCLCAGTLEPAAHRPVFRAILCMLCLPHDYAHCQLRLSTLVHTLAHTRVSAGTPTPAAPHRRRQERHARRPHPAQRASCLLHGDGALRQHQGRQAAPRVDHEFLMSAYRGLKRQQKNLFAVLKPRRAKTARVRSLSAPSPLGITRARNH